VPGAGRGGEGVEEVDEEGGWKGRGVAELSVLVAISLFVPFRFVAFCSFLARGYELIEKTKVG